MAQASTASSSCKSTSAAPPSRSIASSSRFFETSAEDGSEINKVIVPAILGTRIVPDYIGYREHVVKKGDTLSAIARTHYGKANLYPRIVRANPTQISDPDLIFPGQVLKIPIGSG